MGVAVVFYFVAKSCLTFFETPQTAARLLYPWDYSGTNTGVGCDALFQGIFLTQGWNLHLLHRQADSLPLSHQGSPHRRVKRFKQVIICKMCGMYYYI